jgi:transposase, IS5 family
MNHALVKLVREIDWRFLEERFGVVYTDKPGQPPLPTRLMAGASDPQAHLRPFRRGFVRSLGGEPVLLVLLRRGVFPTCVGEEKLKALLQESLAVATRTDAIKPPDLAIAA